MVAQSTLYSTVPYLKYDFCQVELEVCDVTKVQYPFNSFDVIYSRDDLLNIPDNNGLFTKFLVSFTKYCCKTERHQESNDRST